MTTRHYFFNLAQQLLQYPLRLPLLFGGNGGKDLLPQIIGHRFHLLIHLKAFGGSDQQSFTLVAFGFHPLDQTEIDQPVEQRYEGCAFDAELLGQLALR